MSDPLDVMEREISAQSDLVVRCLASVAPQLDHLLPRDLSQRIKRVHLVGCGDSFQAGLAARLAFEQWGGLWTEAHMALEFNAHRSPRIGPGDLVVPISNSGKVARTVETAVMGIERRTTKLPPMNMCSGRISNRQMTPPAVPMAQP